MVGTIVGASMMVVLTALFPQNRVGFLVSMALWAAICAFGNALTRNFSAYAFALSGYTLAIVAGDSIPDPSQAFHVAITRASEIIIGIGCATAVMSLSELGKSRGRLAGSMDAVGREILERFGELLRDPAGHVDDGPSLRRALMYRVAKLDPLIDQTVGEEPELRLRVAILRDASLGLLAALSNWRIAESHLGQLPRDEAERRARLLAELLPETWREPGPAATATAAGMEPHPGGIDDHPADRLQDLAAARTLAELAFEDGVSQRLLADAAARVTLGLGAAANGVALLRDPASARGSAHAPSFVVADYLPAVVNAIRSFLAICAGIAFWIFTEWPNGLQAMTFVAATVLLFAPQQEKSAKAVLGFAGGVVLTACLAALADFALLPNHESFLALAAVMTCFLLPLAALSTVPALAPYFVGATTNFVPLLGPSNQISFDTLSFYNSALGIVGGCLAGALALALIPPVPKLMRADRLVGLTQRDLRRMAGGRWSPSAYAWQHRVYARLIAMPADVDPVNGSRLVAALTTGLQVMKLRGLAGTDAAGDRLRAALGRLAARDVDGLLAGLDAVDADLWVEAGGQPDLGIPTAIQVIRDVARQHRHEFEGR